MKPIQGYSRTALTLHWFMAISIFFLFISSWWMLGLPLASAEYRFREIPFQLHKNLGITLVAVILILLYVRFKHRPQPHLNQILPSRIARLARIDHVLLYLVIFACCLSGYLSSSYSGWGTTLWWVVDLPNWGYENEELNILYSDMHLWTCWILLALMAVHISGALYHGFRDDGVIRRMLHL
jgi:cytochrome b561